MTVPGGIASWMLGTRRVAADAPCLIIGEVAQAHDGSLAAAHAFVDAIADAGADAVKFQAHLAAAESTPAEPFRVPMGGQDATRYDYWKRMEFSEAQWRGLRAHADRRGLAFLCSPFSQEAAERLRRAGVAAWKIASGEVSNTPLLEWLAQTRLPAIISSGMSPLAELDAAVGPFIRAGVPRAVLQCTSAYPCPPEQIGLNVLAAFRARYACPVGLSDHSGQLAPGIIAAWLGASIVEVHVTLSRRVPGPDAAVSHTPETLRQLVEGIRFAERARTHPVDKDKSVRLMAPLRAIFTKSVVARRPLPAGAILAAEDLALKKPGTGIPAARLSECVGRRLRRPVAADELLREDDLDTAPEATLPVPASEAASQVAR